MNICCTCDDGYILPLRVMLESLSRHGGNATLWLVYSDVQESNIEIVAGDAQRYGWGFYPIKIDGKTLSLCSSLPSVGRFGKEVYYRMFIPWILLECDKVLYVDCDTLVCGSLTRLYEAEMGDAIVAAVPDSTPEVEDANAKRLGLLGHYYNSGVLLIDCQSIRNRVSEEEMFLAVRTAVESVNLVFPDQDLLNIIYQGRFLTLDKAWNYPAFLTGYVHMLPVSKKLDWVRIFHFYSDVKPWRADYTGVLVFKYWRHLKKFLSKAERREHWRQKRFMRAHFANVVEKVSQRLVGRG